MRGSDQNEKQIVRRDHRNGLRPTQSAYTDWGVERSARREAQGVAKDEGGGREAAGRGVAAGGGEAMRRAKRRLRGGRWR